jgi:hypothetical protein
MATANQERDTSVRPPGMKYPWDKWQDGQWWTIERDVDFTKPTVESMRDQLHVRAKATGVKVKTHTDKISKITFTFQKPGESDADFADRSSAGR